MLSVIEHVVGTPILHLYLFGSRVYFNRVFDHDSSDVDCVVILSDQYFENLKLNLTTRFMLKLFTINDCKQFEKILISEVRDEREYNISIYSETTFERMIEDHAIFILFCVHNTSEVVRFKETLPIHCNCDSSSTSTMSVSTWYYKKYFRKHKLVSSVLTDVNRAWQKAFNKILKENDVSKGIKLITYCFRFLGWAQDLLKYGAVCESIHHGNSIYMHLLKLCEACTNNQELYSIIMKEYNGVFDEEMENFTTNSEYSVLYPKAPKVTKLENTQQEKVHNFGCYLSEIKKFYEYFGDLDRFHSIFSITNKSLGQNLYILQSSDESPSDTYPMVHCCMSGLVVLIHENKSLTFTGIPIIPSVSFAWTPSSKKPKERSTNFNTETTLFVKYEKQFHRKLICWNSYWKEWSVISCRDLCLLDTNSCKDLLCEYEESSEVFEQIHCFTLIVDEDEQTHTSIIVGFTCLFNDDTFQQGFVTDSTDLQPYLRFTRNNALPFVSSFISPIYSSRAIPSISSTSLLQQVMLSLQAALQSIFEDSPSEIEMIEVMQKDMATYEKTTIFHIKAPFNHFRITLSKFIHNYSDCVFKNFAQFPKSITHDLCFSYMKWIDEDFEKNFSLLLQQSSQERVSSCGNTIQILGDYLRQQLELLVQLENQLLNLYDAGREMDFTNISLKISTFKVELHSLIKSILIHMKKQLSHYSPEVVKREQILKTLRNCLRATENSKIRSLLLQLGTHMKR